MRKYTPFFVSTLTLVALPVSAAGLRFTDQTEAAGLSFSHEQAFDHRSGPMGGGGAVGDFNGDGYADLFVLGGGGSDALFINNRDGTFTNRAEEWGLDTPHRGTGATVADFDGDGDLDLYVTSMGDMESVLPSAGHHKLYRNDGGRFTDVAGICGVNRTASYPDGYGAAFGDYDLDGDLDLFVAGWHRIGQDQAFGSRLFRNRGDGTFDDATDAANVIQSSTFGFGGIFADMDGDRYPELLVAGDFGTTRYYRNNRDGTFSELDPGSGVAPSLAEDPNWTLGKAHNGMGQVVADVNRDGRPDWFVTAIWPTFHYESAYWGNGLYFNLGGHVFDERTEGSGVADGGWGWGAAATDFDHDGRLDLMMTNGWPFTDEVTGQQFDGEASYLFRQRKDGSFRDVAGRVGLDHTLQGRGLMTLDYDRDGDMDVVILSNQDALRLYRNELVADGPFQRRRANWLQVSLDTSDHPTLAPGGVGAEVVVRTRNAVQHAWMNNGGSFISSHEAVLHFGLRGKKRIDSVSVNWPNGKRTVLRDVRANRRITVRP